MALSIRSQRLLLVAALVLCSGALAACAEIDKMERENYQHACDNLGIQRGTPTYDECMMQQQKLDREEML